MSARIYRSEEPEKGRSEGVSITPSPYTEGPQPLPYDVSEGLLAHIRSAYPNQVPIVEPGEDPVLALGRAQGQQAVVRFLEYLHKEQQDKQ